MVHIAAAGNCCENIKYFFKKIDDKKIFEQPDGFGRRPLHLAAERNHIEAIQLLVKLGCEIDVQDKYGRTAFHLAAEIDQVRALECLFKLGCKINTQDKYSRTPLHVAASNGAIGAVEYLLKIKANLEATDNKDRTPLHLAARDGQLEMIKYLVMEQKADLFKKDIKGRTPLEVAKTHPDNYANKTKLQEACDFLSGTKKWYSQPKDSLAPQRFLAHREDSHRQNSKTEWKPRQSKSDESRGSWQPKR